MKQLNGIFLLTILLCISSFTTSKAQIFGTNAVARNSYMEVGLSQCGVYGTSALPAAAWGYHPSAGLPGLGFVCDYQKDGWLTSTAGGFNYCGDYFVPGTPVEGWSLTFNGVSRINTNTGCTTFAIPGSITKWVNTATIDTMEWTGAVAGMSVLQRTLLPNDSLFFVTEVVLCNTTAATMTNVYYGRNLDPDNEQPWTGNFSTQNTIVSQPIFPSTDALVTAMGLTGRCFLGLGARDTRARVNYGGFATPTAVALYTGTGRTIAVGASAAGDVANGIGYSLGNMAPGECVCLSFVYCLSASMLNSALSATSGILVSADSTDITATGATTLCAGDSVTLSLGGSAGGYAWTWSPATGLSSTTGSTVNAAPPVTTTYTVTGTPTGFTCGTEVVSITVTVDNVVADAGPDVNGCPGETLSIGGAGTAGTTYSWSPTVGITGSTTTTPTTVSFPTAGDYTIVLTALHPLTGCTDTDTMVVHVGASAPPIFTMPDTVCVGDEAATITFFGDTTGASFFWTLSPTSIPGSISGQGPHSVIWTTSGEKFVSLYVVYGTCSTLIAMDSVQVLDYAVADIAPVPDQCFPGHSFDFTNLGFVPPGGVNYNWAFGPDATPTSSTSPAPTGVTFATPGVKWVTLYLDNHACDGYDTLFFNLNPEPVASFSISADSVCLGDPVNVTFTGDTTGATTYFWTLSPGSTPASLSGPGPHSVSWGTGGMQYIDLMVAYGPCTTDVVTDSVFIWDPPVADISPVPDQCFIGHSFDFTAVAPVIPGATYNWEFGPDATPTTSTSPTPTGVTFATDGVKFVILNMDNHGCTDTDTVFFNINPQPLPSFTISDDSICVGNAVTVNFTGTTVGATSYIWTLTGTTVPASLSGPGPHSVTWTTTGWQYVSLAVVYGPCTTAVVIDSIMMIDGPIASISPTPDQCFTGHSFDFSNLGATAPTTTYSWTFEPDGTPATSTATSETGVTFATPGPKMVTLSVSNMGCTDTDTIYFNVNPQPDPSFNLITEACVGAPVTITFTGDTTGATAYLWTLTPTSSPASLSGAGPHTLSWTTSGLKFVTLAVVYGPCTSAVAIDSIMIWDNPVASINPVPNQCFAFGANSFDFSSAGPYDPTATFLWTFGPGGVPATSASEFPTGINFTTPGPKVVGLQISQHGCVSNIDTIHFTVYPDPNPAIAYTSASTCFEDNMFDFTAVPNVPTATYDWTFEDGITGSASGPVVPGVSFFSCGTKTITLTMTENGCSTTIIDSVEVFCNPVVDAGLAASFCEGTGGVNLSSSVVGGTAPYYYVWSCAVPPCGIDSVFDDDPNVNPDISMWYYVQVTDFNGCTSAVDSVFVTVLPKPIANAGPDLWLCAPPSPCEMLGATVTGSAGPFSYQWTGSVGLSNDTIANPCARPDTTTIYTIVVTDLTTGCTSETSTTDTNSTVTVHVVPVPIADAGPDRDICEGDTIMLLGLGYGAGPSYAYEWSPFTPPVSLSANNIPNPLAFPALTSDYVLTVWSNSCPSYGDTVTVRVHTQPTVDAGPDRDICQGESALLDGNAWGDPSSGFYTFEWWNPATLDDALIEDPTATPDTTTTYYIMATSQYGCGSPIDSVLVQVKPSPIAEAGAPIQICRGDSVMLNGSYYYSGTPAGSGSTVWATWSPNTDISSTTILNPVVWPTSTMYYVLGLQQNTCTSMDSVLITVMNVPQISLDADTSVVCAGDSVQIITSGGLGGASVDWTPGTGLSDSTAASPWAYPSTTTTYTVTYAEGNCSADEEITVNVIPLPDMAYMSSQTSGCAPLTVSFLETSTNAIAYVWEFGDGSISNELSPIHTYETPGTYYVTLTGVNYGGCSATIRTIVVTVTDPGTAEFTADPTFPVEMSLPNTEVHFTDRSQHPATWMWTFGDGGTASEQNPVHIYQQPGDYTVTLTITTQDGCMSQVSHGPFVVKTPDLFIPNVFSPNADGINDEWWVRYTGDQPFTAQVRDRWGKLLFETKNKMETWKGTTLEGQDAPDGVYFYTVRVGDQQYAGDVTLLR